MALISRGEAWQTHQWHAEMQRKLSGPSLCQCSSECPAEVRHARNMRFHWYRGKGWRHAGHQKKSCLHLSKIFWTTNGSSENRSSAKKSNSGFLGKAQSCVIKRHGQKCQQTSWLRAFVCRGTNPEPQGCIEHKGPWAAPANGSAGKP